MTAKGIEDTAFYIYNRLVSLNEVGGEPDHFGTAPAALHAWLAAARPLAARAVGHLDARHQAQRGRARAHQRALGDARRLEAGGRRAGRAPTGAAARSIDGQSYPSRNEEYLLYQTLVGILAARADGRPTRSAAYRERIVAYMHKAMREAKVNTSWLNPSEPHEQAMTRFVEVGAGAATTRRSATDFVAFQRRVAQLGIYNSLAQLALKIAAPGVPDFYQGTELWDFSLVDPDNRRPVDYARRRALLAELDAAIAARRSRAPSRRDWTRRRATIG